MDSPKVQLHVPKVEKNHNEFDWLYLEKQTQGMYDQQLTFTDSFDQFMNSFMEFDLCQTPYQNNQIIHFEFKDFQDIRGGDMGFWDFNIPSFYDDIVMDTKVEIMNSSSDHHLESVGGSLASNNEVQEFAAIEREEVKRQSSGNGKSKCAALELDEIQKYFDVPITKAAKELKVGLTVLKKRCRELNIMRWPHRKIKSLKSLIDNVKELGLTKEIEMLEEHRRMVEKLPELELTERTKKLRQACFKANYKKRRVS
ncbi:unnamed protein product [Camellia sinensis]